ncbi:MAG: PorV/PorQ family protein [Elusimicrobiota bacterium]|jgi:hypothetical protein
MKKRTLVPGQKALRALRKSTVLLSLLSLWSLPAAASSGTEGASFLDIPVGAEPAAMGSAYSALATNAYAPVWNPGGLGFLANNEMAGQHLSYLGSIHYEYLSFVHPFDDRRGSLTHRGIGVSAQYLGSGDMVRTEIDPNNQPLDNGVFSSHYASYNVSYGQTVNEKIALGLTGKWINAKIDEVSANAYAADLGVLYHASDKLSLASTLTNMGSKLKFLEEGDSLPLAFHLGAAFQPNTQWQVTMEGVYRRAGPTSFHAGGQWRPIETVSLRVGYKTDTLKGLSAVAGLTTGIGIHVWGQELAYAWSPYGELGNAQYVSLLIRFGEREQARRNLIQYQTIKKQRIVKNEDAREVEPEYQQLMELLSDHEHVAQTNPSQLLPAFNQ